MLKTPRTLAFEKAAAYQYNGGQAIDVRINEYGVLQPNDTLADILLTQYANVCSGLALFGKQGQAGLMHLFSKFNYFVKGEEAVRAHARNAFIKFHSAMNTSDSLSAVLFGAHRYNSNSISSHLDNRIAEYFEMYEQLDQINNSQACRSLDEKMMLYDWDAEGHSQKHYMDILHALENLTRQQMQYFRRPDVRTLRDGMALCVSTWLADTLYDCAVEHDIGITEDFRYKDAPHDAVYDRKQDIFAIGKYGSLPLERWNKKDSALYGTRIFDSLELSA